jgi:predicted RNA-binding Zn ribbon-like protein
MAKLLPHQKNRHLRSKADFRFDDARLCFAFVGTLANRGTGTPFERLNGIEDLGRWCVESGCVQKIPPIEPEDLAQAKELREAIQHASVALIRRRLPGGEYLETINRAAALPPLTPRLVKNGKYVEWHGETLSSVLSTVARDFIEISSSTFRTQIRLCGNPTCGIPFVDTSRAGTRRWCSMKTCGALVKKRNYRARKLSVI